MAFPNQIPKVILSLEQAERLTSRVRSDVFWEFSPREAMSASQVAKALSKSAQTVHYHVKELVDVGLLIPAGTRQNRSRTEILYVHKGEQTFDQGAAGTPEHNAMRAKSFRFTVNRMVEEAEAFYEVIALDPSRFKQGLLLRKNVVLTAEQSVRLHTRLSELLTEILSEQGQQEGDRIHVMFYTRPTVGQSQAWLRELKGTSETEDDSEDGDEQID